MTPKPPDSDAIVIRPDAATRQDRAAIRGHATALEAYLARVTIGDDRAGSPGGRP